MKRIILGLTVFAAGVIAVLTALSAVIIGIGMKTDSSSNVNTAFAKK